MTNSLITLVPGKAGLANARDDITIIAPPNIIGFHASINAATKRPLKFALTHIPIIDKDEVRVNVHVRIADVLQVQATVTLDDFNKIIEAQQSVAIAANEEAAAIAAAPPAPDEAGQAASPRPEPEVSKKEKKK